MFPVMSIPPPTNPVGRLIRVYNAQERAAIDPFKTEYMAATTPAARQTIAQVHILPALFNYWTSTGLIIDDDEMRGRAVVCCRKSCQSISFIGFTGST
jgi:hypothetical protein